VSREARARCGEALARCECRVNTILTDLLTAFILILGAGIGTAADWLTLCPVISYKSESRAIEHAVATWTRRFVPPLTISRMRTREVHRERFGSARCLMWARRGSEMSGKRHRNEREARKRASERQAKLDALAHRFGVNRAKLARHGMCIEPDFVVRGCYIDEPFMCQQCGASEVWTAAQQKLDGLRSGDGEREE
jgi:hypothetical protein